jgi:phage terminase large subunit-like protein
MLQTAKAYAREVLNGDRVACYWVKKAAERFLNDLERSDVWIDEEDLELKYRLASNLIQYKGAGAGRPVNLQPHQIFSLCNVFGFKKYDEEGNVVRRFSQSYISIARKNGKTTEEAIKQLIHLFTDGENAPRIYAAATKEDQAKLVVNDAGNIVKKTPALAKRCKLFEHNGVIKRVIYPENGGMLTSIGADSTTQDGLDVSHASVDEFHAFKSDDLRDVLETGTGARRSPLIDILTTAGNSVNSPCYRFEQKVRQVLKGVTEDDSLFCVIYTLDEGDDYRDPSVWEKANPNLGVSVRREDLKRKVNQAETESDRKRVAILTKNFNVWTQSSGTFIKGEDWKKLDLTLSDEYLSGFPCFGGLDLSSNKDLTALTLAFELGEFYYLKFYFFTNWEQAKSEDRRANYLEWIRAGELLANEGNAIDLNEVEGKIKEAAQKYDVRSIGFDRYNSSQLVANLTDEGIKMSPFSQSIMSMSGPTKQLERLVLNGGIRHEINRCMDWQVENIEIKKDSSDNYKINKGASGDRVDGPVSAVMAIGEALNGEKVKKKTSVFDRESGLI